MFKKENKELQIAKTSAAMIPYMSVSPQGVFETAPGNFSYTYKLSATAKRTTADCLTAWEKFLEDGENVRDFQLSICNTDAAATGMITFNTEADDPSAAMGVFENIRRRFNENFVLCGVPMMLGNMDLRTILQQIHGIYHSFKPGFMAGMPDAPITAQTLKSKGITTKDLIGSNAMKASKDYFETDGGLVRVLMFNSFSDHLSPGFLSKYVSAGENTYVTAHFHPVSAKTVMDDLAAELEDLKVKCADRTSKTPVYPNYEEIRLKEAHIELLKESVQTNTPLYRITILIAVFGDDEAALEKSTEALKTLAADSFCRLFPLDFKQAEAVKSLLPLAKAEVDAGRIFLKETAALFFPGVPGKNDVPQPINRCAAEKMNYTIKARMPKPKSAKRGVKRTVQETIPYTAAYWEDGIFENEPGVFSKVYRFTDINYHTATEDDQITFLEKYAQLLNRLDNTVRCQVILMNKNVDMREFIEQNTLEFQKDGLDTYRDEYNKMIVAKMEEGRNNLKKERYFVISTDAENFDAAKTTFARLDPEMIAAFKEIGGSQAETITTQERLELLYDIFNIGNEGSFLAKGEKDGVPVKALDPDVMTRMGITSKDLIAPSCFDFKRDWFRMGKKYCRILFLTELPNSLSDKFLSDLTATNCNLVLSMNLNCMRQDKAVALTRRQLTNINTMVQKAQQNASKNGYSMELVPAEIKQAQEEANSLLSGLTGANQKMFTMTFTVLVYGDSMEELNTNCEMLISTGHKYLCNLKKLDYQQEDGLASTLPLCNNRLTIKRTLTTNSTVIFVPFDVQELNQRGGLYYGQNASSHNLIIYDRRQAQNSNGWVLGTPGSGKSFSAKREIASVILNTEDDVLIIDPEREYGPMAQAFKGSIVRVAPGSKWHLNPLDLDPDYADGDDPIVLKSDFMISLCETAVGGKYGLEPMQNSIIDRCVRQVYQDFIAEHNMDPEYTPTLLDFQNVLESQPEMAAKELAIALEIYTKGALDVFAHKSNVDINNRFVVYDIKDIGSSALRTLAYLVVLDNIWDRVVKNRRLGKRTWVYMDEIYVLFEREQSTNFIRQIFSRGRKYGAVMTALTQNVSPILMNDTATTMLSNSAFIELLNQAPVDRDLLAGLLNISPQQVSYINSASPGHGLLYVQNVGIIPFADNFPKHICPEMYKVMTSKPDELMEEFR